MSTDAEISKGEAEDAQPITRADLANLTPAEIVEMHRNGGLDHLIGKPPRPTREGPLTRDDLKRLTHTEVTDQYRAGNLNHLL